MSKVISVANQKGGVGKTTTSVNLAASTALAEKKILVIDMDPQANTSSGLGFMLSSEDNSIYEVLTSRCDVEEAIIETQIKNLHLLPSKQDLAAIEVELVEDLPSAQRAFLLKEKIQGIYSQYDYIFLDCPPSLGLLTINSLCTADTVLIPVQTEYFAMEGLGRLTNTVAMVQEELNPELNYEGILLCMTDDRTNLSKQVSAEIIKHFGELVFKTTIPRNVRVSESPSYGKPVILYSVDSKGARAYINLADEFLKRNEN